MIELRHIEQLEQRVHSAIALIGELRTENAELKTKLDGYERRIGELERLVDDFKRDQSAIEDGILRALKQLDALEDTVTGADEPPRSTATATQPGVVENPAAEAETAQDDGDRSEERDSEEAGAAEPKTGEGELDIF